jgi:hypothetical protein
VNRHEAARVKAIGFMKAKIFRSWRLALATVEVILIVAMLKGPLAAVGGDSSGSAVAATDATTQNAPITAAVITQASLSTGAKEVVKLAQAGMGEDVLLAYIGAAKSPFSLGSDQIVYLNDLGIPGIVVKAMIQRDAALNADAANLAAATNAPLAIPDPNAPYPPDDGATLPPPPPDDTGATATADNPGDYSSADDTAYFYDSLAPYGSWVYVAGMGLCWQPTVYTVDRSWRPYRDLGRWIYTDCGWYWQSDYSWGWAPFHYGRWFRDQQRGWVWAPDRLWAPAWVSWRQSAEYSGWAPLPPAAKFVPALGFRYGNNYVRANFEFGLTARQYVFIPIERMTDSAPARYALLPSQSAELYQETKVVNNYTVENNRVVSHGVDPQQVAKVSGEEIRQAQIRELPGSSGKNVPAERLAKRDGQLMIFRPQLPKPDVNYLHKLPAAAAAAGSTRQTVISRANNPPRLIPGQPLVLGRSPETMAAQTEHKSFYLMVPQDPFAQQPAASVPTRNNGVGDDRFNHTQISPMLADGSAQSREPYPANGYSSPQYYYPQSSVLTPSRSQNDGRPASYYPGQEPSRPEARTSAAQPAPIYVPPAYSHAESAPAPAYHPPPAESHPAPPPESHPSPSSASSSSSSSGHR